MSEPLDLLVKTEMPYGKYKATLIADLLGSYLNWFAREGFPKGQLGRLLALMHELDHNGLKHLLDPLRDARSPYRGVGRQQPSASPSLELGGETGA